MLRISSIFLAILSPTPLCSKIKEEVDSFTHCSLVPRLEEKQPGNFCESKLLLLLPESWQLQSSFRTSSHDTTAKSVASCWKITVTLIPFQLCLVDLLNQASTGNLHYSFCSSHFCWTAVLEPTAKSCFHKQESPVLSSWKLISITCTNPIISATHVLLNESDASESITWP